MEKNELENLYKTYIGNVFRYSKFKLKNKEDAEDITQETFIELFRRKDLSGIQDIKLYLLGIARNKIYLKYRKENLLTSLEFFADKYEKIIEEKEPMEAKIINEEFLDSLKSKMDLLDEITREVIVLKIWEDMKFNEIAKIINKNENTVKTIYYRGLEKLKKSLEKDRKKKMFVFSLPALILGITQLGKSKEFIIDPKFARALLDQIRENNLFIKFSNMNKLNKLIKELLKRKRWKIMLGILGIILLITILVLLFIKKENGLNNGEQGQITPETTPSAVQTEPIQTEVEKYKNLYNIILMKDGDVFLLAEDSNNELNLTNTSGKVTSYAISNDRQFLAYTTTDPTSVQHIINQLPAAKYTPNQRVGTKMFIKDLNTNTETKLLDSEDLIIPKQQLNYYEEKLLSNNGISIYSFSSDDRFILYYRLGLYAYDVIANQVINFTNYTISDQSRCTVDEIESESIYVGVNINCGSGTEWHIFKYDNNNFNKINLSTLNLPMDTHHANPKDGSYYLLEDLYNDKYALLVVSYSPYMPYDDNSLLATRVKKLNLETREIQDVNINVSTKYRYQDQWHNFAMIDNQIYASTYKIIGQLQTNGSMSTLVDLNSINNSNDGTFRILNYFLNSNKTKVLIMTRMQSRSNLQVHNNIESLYLMDLISGQIKNIYTAPDGYTTKSMWF